MIKASGATRISINPQTMSDKVLAAVGRRHTARQTIEAFYQAVRAGFDDINYAHLTVPKLTTIHQNMERKAELAVTELLSAIQNPIYIGKGVLLDVMLIARDSI